jgi:MFS family permease
MTVLIMILMVGVTGRLVQRFGMKVNIVTGMVFLAVSLFLFATTTPTVGNFVVNVLPASLLGALGMSLAYIPATMASMAGAKPEETGLASGLSNTSYQIGSALGLAAIVAVAATWTQGQLSQGAAQVVALNTGFHAAFVGAAIIALVGALLTLLFIRSPKSTN